MNQRQYYSVRTGKNPNAQEIDLPFLRRLFRQLYLRFHEKYYFQEAFGYYCVDADEVPGSLGHDIDAQLSRALRKPSLWPIEDKCSEYSEDDLFDVIEFLFDHVSKPVDGQYHSFNACGWHYETFDKGRGQVEFSDEVNGILKDYKTGYELTEGGEILELAEIGLENLVKAELPAYDPDNVEKRVEQAILKFRRSRSTLGDRKDAIRDLADVLEFLRPRAKEVLTSKDEGDLFNLANNFGIRHHNPSQKTDYDQAIWYSWMFYYYLSTIHACLRLIEKAKNRDK